MLPVRAPLAAHVSVAVDAPATWNGTQTSRAATVPAGVRHE